MMHCYHCTNNCTSHRAECFDKDECKGWLISVESSVTDFMAWLKMQLNIKED